MRTNFQSSNLLHSTKGVTYGRIVAPKTQLRKVKKLTKIVAKFPNGAERASSRRQGRRKVNPWIQTQIFASSVEVCSAGSSTSGEVARSVRMIALRSTNPDTGKKFLDRNSKIVANRVILRGKDMTELRLRCYQRDQGICQKCGVFAPWDGPVGVRGENMHGQHGGMGGGQRNDVLSNVSWGCHGCHEQRHRPKAVPKKERVSA